MKINLVPRLLTPRLPHQVEFSSLSILIEVLRPRDIPRHLGPVVFKGIKRLEEQLQWKQWDDRIYRDKNQRQVSGRCNILSSGLFRFDWLKLEGEENNDVLSRVLAHSFAPYDAKNEYRGDRNVGRKLLTVDGNDNFRRLPFPLVNGKLTLINLKYTCAKV